MNAQSFIDVMNVLAMVWSGFTPQTKIDIANAFVNNVNIFTIKDVKDIFIKPVVVTVSDPEDFKKTADQIVINMKKYGTYQ